MFHKIPITMLGLALLAGCSPKIDQKKYENLYRAAKAIEGAIAVGITYPKFGELLQNLSTEISIANDKAKSDTEKELLKSYFEVLTTFQESSTVWKYKIEGSRYDWIPKGQIFVEDELRPIIEKYSFPMELHEIKITRNSFTTISENSIKIIWEKAHDQLEKANKIYYGQ